MIIVLLFLLVVAVYCWGIRNHDYWAKRNVKHDKPIPFFGNNLQGYMGKKSFTQIADELYQRFPKEKVVGYYRGTTPELLIRDPDIIRNILSADFLHFYARGLGRNPKVEVLLRNLFHADGDLWKLQRQRLTPAFTSARLKAMFPLVVRCAEKLQDVARDVVTRGGYCDARDLMARFTVDFIGACGFGVDMDSINDEHSAFREFTKLIFARPPAVIVKALLWDFFPIVRSFLHVNDPKVTESLLNFVTSIREQRKCKPSGRHDFIDLLLELELKGTITGDSIERFNADGSPAHTEMEMDMIMMASQVFVFLAAGFETSSSATSYTLLELAFNPEYQIKTQKEIDKVLLKYDNKLCYDAVAEMTLLSMAFKESLRLFPSIGAILRECSRQYTFPELDLTIDPGVKIVIPVNSLHKDEQYFDKPLDFYPERFRTDEIKNHPKYVYLPFGEGPRACIGSRLGEMQSLAGLAALLQRFSVAPAPHTRRPPVIDPTVNIVQTVKGGVPLLLTLRR